MKKYKIKLGVDNPLLDFIYRPSKSNGSLFEQKSNSLN